MKNLKNKVVFITGATRGIGEAVALRCAEEGATIIVTGKSKDPNPKLPGTLDSTCEKIESFGGRAFPYQLDVRDEARVEEVIREVGEKFGCIDVVYNNAGAIYLAPSQRITMKQFDLMQNVNMRGSYVCTKAAIPYLKKAENPHVINMSPPISLDPIWFKDHLPYTISKYGISLCTVGFAAELRQDGIAVNSIWPACIIATMAIMANFGPEMYKRTRKPKIVADAIRALIDMDSKTVTGNFFTDEDILKKIGITDFSSYATKDYVKPYGDLYLD